MMKKWKEILKKNESLFYFWRGYLLFGILLLCCILPLIIRTFFLLEDNVRTNTEKMWKRVWISWIMRSPH